MDKPLKRILGEYVETWPADNGYPGFCIVRVVEEEGKPICLERGAANYLKDHPDMSGWYSVYEIARSQLRSTAWWKK